MTEEEWLSHTRPARLINFLGSGASDRKLRLLACAGCRLVWPLFADWWSRHAVETSERFADGEATDGEREAAWRQAIEGRDEAEDAHNDEEESPQSLAVTLVRYAAEAVAWDSTGGYTGWRALPDITNAISVLRTNSRDQTLAQADDDFIFHSGIVAVDALARQERADQADLVRDIFGNPFRPVVLDPAWRTEHTVGIAGKMYEDRDFAAMPILADALEEAGCDNADILSHCREPGVHVRGCWVVDLVLGK